MLTSGSPVGTMWVVEARAVPPADTASAALVEAWLAGLTSDNTRSGYRTDLATFSRWCVEEHAIPVCADTATLAAFGLARQAVGDSEATLRRRWSSLSSFYQYAMKTGTVANNPVAGIGRPPERPGSQSPTTVLTAEAVDAYLAVAAQLDPRLETLVSMLVRDGIKVGEALAIDADDITGRPPRTSVTIRRNGKTRRVRLDESTARAVRRCLGRRTGQPLFVSDHRARTRTPQRLSRFGADHLIRQLGPFDDERVTANELRRFYITSQHDRGRDVNEVRIDAGLADARGVTRFVDRHGSRTTP